MLDTTIDGGQERALAASAVAGDRAAFEELIRLHGPAPVSYTHLTLPTTPYV